MNLFCYVKRKKQTVSAIIDMDFNLIYPQITLKHNSLDKF